MIPMKITQSQLKSLVRTIVKESVSELTKGKRRRSLKEASLQGQPGGSKSGKVVYVLNSADETGCNEIELADGTVTSFGKLAKKVRSALESKHVGLDLDSDDLVSELDSFFTGDNQNIYADILKLNGISKAVYPDGSELTV